MNLYWLYDSQRLVQSMTNGLPIASMRWTANDVLAIRLSLLTGTGNVLAIGTLPQGKTIRFALKPVAALDGVRVASQTTWTLDTVTSTYTAALNLASADLIAALGSLKVLDCIGEFAMVDAQSNRSYTTQFSVRVLRNIDTDGTPGTSLQNEWLMRGGYLYAYNPDTLKWHKVAVRGVAGAVTMGIEQQGSDLT